METAILSSGKLYSKTDCRNPPFSARCTWLNLLPNFQKGGGGLAASQLLEGFAGKEGLTFFRGLQFLHTKRNLKHLMTTKVYKQKYFALS